jgi:iron complex transport system permease protein
VCLAGSAVAVAGPVAFVGLIVPHIVRLLAGTNHLVVIPVSGLLGAALVMLADVACRYVQFPFETPTGVVTALLGTPFFIYLARSQARRTR